MSQDQIFAPMGVLALLTFAVLMVIPVARVRAVRGGRAKVTDFRYGESPEVPGDVSISNRNYMNLLELPTLFYAVALMFFVTGSVTLPVLAVAWAYVGLRVIHSIIHLTYNNVLHRLAAFGASNVVLGVLWIQFALR